MAMTSRIVHCWLLLHIYRLRNNAECTTNQLQNAETLAAQYSEQIKSLTSEFSQVWYCRFLKLTCIINCDYLDIEFFNYSSTSVYDIYLYCIKSLFEPKWTMMMTFFYYSKLCWHFVEGIAAFNRVCKYPANSPQPGGQIKRGCWGCCKGWKPLSITGVVSSEIQECGRMLYSLKSWYREKRRMSFSL